MLTETNLHTGKVKLKDIAVTIPKTINDSDVFKKLQTRERSAYVPVKSANIMDIISIQNPVVNMILASGLCMIFLLFTVLFLI